LRMESQTAQMVVHIIIACVVTIFGGLNIVVIVRGVWYIRGLLSDVKTGQELIVQRLAALETLPGRVEVIENDVETIKFDLNHLFGSVREIKKKLGIDLHEHEHPFTRDQRRKP
jgi:hypothetical protein